MKLGIIGRGAIAHYVTQRIEAEGHEVSAYLVRPARVDAHGAQDAAGRALVSAVADLPRDLDLIADCAGHQALRSYGPEILRAGIGLVTVSLGALADAELEQALTDAAQSGGAPLILATGAIGALDALRSARAGRLSRVQYTGRKPPAGWRGSPAEAVLDLNALTDTAVPHFQGTAREAALRYPKNANVAAAVALAGIGFDRTEAQLIADPTISENIHEITAEGDFGHLAFQIAGNPLPDNPKSSALAAMSVVATILQQHSAIRF